MMKTTTTKLGFNFFLGMLLLLFFHCSKNDISYSNPIFNNFFSELDKKNVEEFYNSYYKDKPNEYKEAYLEVLKDLKKYNSNFIITDYKEYQGAKPSIDGGTKGIFILKNNNLKDEIIVKIENNKVQYLLPISKGKEDIIGWL